MCRRRNVWFIYSRANRNDTHPGSRYSALIFISVEESQITYGKELRATFQLRKKSSDMKNLVCYIFICFLFPITEGQTIRSSDTSLFYDSHFHLTNYIQEGVSVQNFLRVMGTRVGRSTLFGIPLQQ